MKAESLREQGAPQLNLHSPLLRNVRFCKSIAPKPGTTEEKLMRYTSAYPRIVKSEFKVPANWEVKESFKNGETFYYPKRDVKGHPIPVRGRNNTILAHTCAKPFDDCYNGFWGKWKPNPLAHSPGIEVGLIE